MAAHHAPATAVRSPPPTGRDRRLSVRCRPRAVTLTRLTVVRDGASYFAWVHDLSATGVGFEILAPVRVGALVRFTLRGAGGRPVALQAVVMHVTPVHAHYRVGGQFIAPPPGGLLAAVLQPPPAT